MSTPARPSLPASSLDFALPPSTSSLASHQTLAATADDLSPFMLRARRPSLLALRHLSEGRLQSPLSSSSFTYPLSRRYTPLWRSGSATPLLPGPIISSDSSDSNMKTSRPRTPATPPRESSTTNGESLPDTPLRTHARRPSNPVKVPRILTLRTESHPEECEVRSEAQFQRLVASCCELPSQPRTPRAASDRGRYPEEADCDEPHREDTPSDDGELDEQPFAFVEPISIAKPVTPAHSVNGDDLGMMESPGGVAMDVDMPMTLGSPIMSNWRYTPPPTSSAVRSNKRKLDDRYDPYPNASKRRACRRRSPRCSMAHIWFPTYLYAHPYPDSQLPTSPLEASVQAGHVSPTLRAQIGLSSPVLRPMVRRRFGEEEKEVDGLVKVSMGSTSDEAIFS
ncbi:hypothetical protein B0H21DRAFT_818819 [Amylocystis lapponica]|nr:hypothetical protein B0H21DRAFT_818819 [Amylocystis lapponica]